MFKRVQHQQDKKRLAEELGLDVTEAVADYDESSEESSLDEASDSSSTDESSETAEAANDQASKKRKVQDWTEGRSDKKAKAGSKEKASFSISPSGDEKDTGDEEMDSDDGSDDDSDSDDDEDESPDGEASASKGVLPPMSVSKVFTDPLYIKPDAPFYKGFQHRTCILCPSKLIKTEEIAKTHVASASHQRAMKRYITYAKREVPANKLDFYGEGMVDPRHLVAEIQARLQKQQLASKEKATKGSQKARIDRLEKTEKPRELEKRILRGETLTPEEREGLTKRERRIIFKAQKKLKKKAKDEAKTASGVKHAEKESAITKEAEEGKKQKISTGGAPDAEPKVKKQGRGRSEKANKKLTARQAQVKAHTAP